MKRLNSNLLSEYENYNFTLIKEDKIGLVGSIRFKEYFLEIESILQIIYKKIVSICSIDGLLNKNKFSSEEWEELQVICIKKLKDQEAILVLDVNGYVGNHTKEEIEYFLNNLGKPVYLLSKIHK